MKCSWPLIAT
jgi:hypothetical protein